MKAIREYFEKANIPQVIINRKINSYEKNPDIANEFEKWILTKEYVTEDCVTVENYTAKKISELSEFLDGEGAFSMLIMLREDPQKALEKIKKGFLMR